MWHRGLFEGQFKKVEVLLGESRDFSEGRGREDVSISGLSLKKSVVGL